MLQPPLPPSGPARSGLASTRQRLRLGRWWVALGVLLVAGASAFLLLRRETEHAPTYETVPVTRGNIERTVTALATVEPKTYVDVGTQVSGLLSKIHVEIGDEVKKGALLAEIDPTVYKTKVLGDQAQLDNLKAQLAQQEAQLGLDRLRDDRAQKLLVSRAGSQDAADATSAAVLISAAKIAALKAQIKQTEATLQGDLANLGYTKIFAPMDGTVVTVDAREGQTLNANMTAPVILRVSDLDTMQVKAQVAEADIPKVKVGMDVYFTTLGMPDKRFSAKVVQILPTPETINDVVLYSVLIDVPNTERLLMTSMSAQVFFQLGSAKNVLLVPVAAVQPVARRAKGEAGADDAAVVRVLVDGAPLVRRIKTGLSSRTQMEVKDGLKEGEEVITTPAPSSGQARRFGPPPLL